MANEKTGIYVDDKGTLWIPVKNWNILANTEKATESGKNDGLSHAQTGFPKQTEFTFDHAKKGKRVLFIGLSLTSHPEKTKSNQITF